MFDKNLLESEVQTIVERMWNDVAGLPWQDKGWLQNPQALQSAKNYFTGVAISDIMLVCSQDEIDGLNERRKHADNQSQDAE